MSSPIPITDFIMVALDEEEAQNGWPDNMKPKDVIADVSWYTLIYVTSHRTYTPFIHTSLSQIS